MKKSELKASIKNEIIEILSEESAEDIQDKAKAQAELNKELEKTKDLMKEGTWALGKASDINIILTQLQDISKKAYNVIGDDIFYDGLDNAISRAEELMMNAPLNEEEEDAIDESLNPEVSKAVNHFVKAMAKRYNYSEQDAVFAIQAALKQREFDKPADIPGFEGTMDALDSLSIREEEDDEPSTKDIKSSSKDSVSKIANKLGETTNQMKKLVKKYKDAEEPEKTRMLARLKELTKIKKELEGLL